MHDDIVGRPPGHKSRLAVQLLNQHFRGLSGKAGAALLRPFLNNLEQPAKPFVGDLIGHLVRIACRRRPGALRVNEGKRAVVPNLAHQ